MEELSRKQINNGFDSKYYLDTNGKVYDSIKDKYIEANQEHKFRLKLIDGKTKAISLKTLYKLVFNQNYCVDNIQDLEGEEWREIEDTNGLYFISSLGRCKSLFGYESIILTPFYNQNGYARVDIHYGSQRETQLIHSLVAAAFLGSPKNLKQQIHHKSFQINDNSAANLEYLSPIEHAKKHAERRAKENAKL